MSRMTLPKSSVMGYNNVNDSMISSDDSGYGSDDGGPSWQRELDEEEVMELAPLIETLNIATQLPRIEFPLLGMTYSEEEYHLENFETSQGLPTVATFESIECVIANVAHLEQFPKPASSYSASVPNIYAWFDAHGAFSSEYPTTVQNYFKMSYNSIRPHLRFFFSIAPSMDRMRKLTSVRRDIPTGRMLFHYIGYGFPKITKENIWCSQGMSTTFEPFSLGELFERLHPPTWYLFDCSNAGVVIDKFKETAERLSKEITEDVDWNDWICLGATSQGEELPDDPRLPKDFLTAVSLTPVKMAVICHILQHYRLKLVTRNFPFDSPCQVLWKEGTPEFNRLSLALAAITDAIAVDSMSHEMYQKIFRNDKLSGVLFRNFLLAQYLLRIYRVHPVSYPAIPDMSAHQLWRQWSILLDTAICCVQPNTRPIFDIDMFARGAATFEVLMRNDQFGLIRPYHLTLLFHMLTYDQNNNYPITLLSNYAMDARGSKQMLVAATVFPPVFARLLSIDPRTPAFCDAAFLVLILLKENPMFANEIGRDVDVNKFPYVVFDREVSVFARVAAALIICALVVSHETMQKICTSIDYLERIATEIMVCDPRLGNPLMTIVRRGFNLYSPEMTVFTTNALHLKCSIAVQHESPLVRAAGLVALICFMSPFECKYNVQLLYMSLSVMGDCSFLVRFHLVLILKKFVSSFDTAPDVDECEGTIDMSSLEALRKSIFRSDKESLFEQIDDLMKDPMCTANAYRAAIALLTLYSKDPHPSVCNIASNVVQFITKRRMMFESMENGDQCMEYADDFEEEQSLFANLDQNEAVYHLTIRYLFERPEIHVAPYTSKLTLAPGKRKICDSPIKSLRYMSETNCFIAAADNCVHYISDGGISSYETAFRICSAEPAFLNHRTMVLISTTRGCIGIWNGEKKYPDLLFRADLQYDVLSPVFAQILDEIRIVTVLSSGVLYVWHRGTESVELEVKLPLSSTVCAVEFSGTRAAIGCSDGNIYEYDITTKILLNTNHDGPVTTLSFVDGLIYSISENCVEFFRDGQWTQLDLGPCLSVIDKDNFVVFSPGEAPRLHRLGTGVVKVFENAENAVTCLSHPKEPFIVFGTSSGEIVVCENP